MNKIRRISLATALFLIACSPLKITPNCLNKKGVQKDELFRDDKLHLNADGYKVWTVIIKDELNKVLNK